MFPVSELAWPKKSSQSKLLIDSKKAGSFISKMETMQPYVGEDFRTGELGFSCSSGSVTRVSPFLNKSTVGVVPVVLPLTKQ